MNVWTYWKCPYCGGINHGRNRECPGCGSPIPGNVKYLMPDNPIVRQAISDGTILIEGEKHVDEKGVVAEVVKENEKRTKANWVCDYCGYQNYDDSITCKGCGATRGSKNYFNTPEEPAPRINRGYSTSSCSSSPSTSSHKSSLISIRGILDALPVIGIILAILALIWLFFPITRSATITGFQWTRSIDVEEFTLCHESGWSVPAGGRTTDTRQEIHHYDKVIDHYETKTRQVSEQVFDGYTTSYRDLGNGQAEVVRTPKYKTVYRTETYQEPVYKSVPVYKTKYYYDIDRWKKVSSLDTSGNDQNAYWYDTALTNSVNNPSYGDQRLGNRHASYYAIIVPEKSDELQKKEYNESEWLGLKIGDTIEYKTFKFSKKPL